MKTRGWRWHLLAALGLALVGAGTIQAQAPPFQCIQVGVPSPTVSRAEGHSELVGDIVMTCTGGIPTPAGLTVPSVDITLLLNTNVTSKVTASNFSEALMIVDEPNSPLRSPSHPLLNCGNTGATDSSGVCPIVSTGDPSHTYDGTPNGYGTGACDGLSGRPAPNSNTCGRPNVFQARTGTMQNPNQANSITFLNIPLDPPGINTTRTIRFTNIRADAAAIGISLNGTAQVMAQIAVNGNISISINNPQQVVSYVVPGMTASIPGGSSAGSPVRVLEGFASSWKTRDVSFTAGDSNGVPGNATFQNNTWAYNGGTHYPADAAQNVPGVVYNTESGFQWQNNTTNAPPSPDPPPGYGLPPIVNSASPLSSPASGISQAGVPNSGTRVALRFLNIPPGASVQAPPVLYVFPQGFAHNGNSAQFQSGATGVMVLTNTDSAGAGAFSPAGGTITSANNLAVYEVLYADTSQLEYTDVPFTLVNASPGTAVQVEVGFAPLYSGSGAAQPSATYPLPRFVDRSVATPCSSNCLTAFPNQGTTTSSTAVTCLVNAGVPPIVRAEGLAESAGDLELDCTGGTPTAAGQPVPLVNITVALNTNVTSKITAANLFSEALLIVDEPNSAVNPSRPLLNCGNTGAPDNGPGGAGVCSIVSTGNPAQTYDGTPNAFGSVAVCDGASGRPLANSYTCGRPNAFQGRTGIPGNSGLPNAITFYGVPFDPPGQTTNRTFRITNLRLDPAAIGASQQFFTTYVQASVIITGGTNAQLIFNSFPLSETQQAVVAFIQNSLSSSVSGSGDPGSSVTVTEGFASAWKPKNISFATGDHSGTPGNAQIHLGNAYWTYDGATNYPLDVAQNVPIAIYNTESGFQWQNNGANAPPSPNPPLGIGTIPVTNTVFPLNSVGYGGLNTGISADGVANAGTRIALRFSNIPSGASIQVPQIVHLTNCSVCAASGVLALTSTDASGAGAYTPASGTITAANPLAVYEILWADPFSIETAQIPFTLVGAPSGSAVQVSVGYAPFYSTAAAGMASATLPEPRFIDSLAYLSCVSGPCISVFPNSGVNTGRAAVAISGGPILNGASAKLRASGLPDIPGTGYNLSSTVLAQSFDLTGATPGPRDVVITPQTGSPFVLAGAFHVLAPPSCTFTVGPQNPSFPAGGGQGSLVVTPSSTQCSWTSSTATPWIALLAKSGNVQPYSVAANPGGTTRSGTISIAGKTITVTQTGSCTYSLSPSSQIFAVAGGAASVNVLTAAGCPWTAASNAGWITVTAGASGSGPGWVTLQAAANAGAPRSGTVAIAGLTFTGTQNSSGCGAIDVSNQVTVTRGAILSNFTQSAYVEQVRLTNTGPAVAGPVYLVVDGLPLSTAPCVGGNCGLVPAPALTFCQSPGGSSLVAAAPTGMISGQSVNLTLTFQPGAASGGVPPTWYTTRIFSGTPSQ